MREPSLAAKLGAEFLGTFLLVFGGCGSVVIAGEFLSKNDVQLGIGLLGIGLAFGLAVLVGAPVIGQVVATSPGTPHAFWLVASISRWSLIVSVLLLQAALVYRIALCGVIPWCW